MTIEEKVKSAVFAARRRHLKPFSIHTTPRMIGSGCKIHRICTVPPPEGGWHENPFVSVFLQTARPYKL